MDRTASAVNSQELPKSLSAASLWKRAIVGILILVVGIFSAAWIFDASIQKPSARFAVPGLSAVQSQTD